MKQTLSITRKELAAYFGTPMALLFVGAFLAVTLFAFFWVDAFFARGVAHVRPLFRWMPVLLIFLVAALTMRQWSEEQRSGTLEMLLTLPISKAQLVVGKFLAVMALVALALALTLFLPLTVGFLGNLDWGPVIGGYLAALLLAAAYTAIGLFVSSRTDNQIVALILTVLVCGAFYLIGTAGVTDFTGRTVGALLRSLGAGSRFESIQRGVIDLRDLLYYVTLTGIFGVLNVLSLDRKRWSTGASTAPYRRGVALTSGLLIVNLLASNLWLYPLNGLRLDLTGQREYSLSPTTRNLLAGLAEPLTIRAYASEKTHPLLAPLATQLADLLREYEIAGRGRVVAEVVDPATDPQLELEANQTYGIQPSAFQISDRYEASVINAYFDVLVRYGDQSEVLSFRDLIAVEGNRSGGVDVTFRNLEYDLTRAVKKAVYGFQSVDNLLASLATPVNLTLYSTAGTVPADLVSQVETIRTVAGELAAKSNGKFTFSVVDPDAAGATVTRQQLFATYKLRPISASLFSDESYYFDLIMTRQSADGQAEWQMVAPTNGDFSEANLRTAIEGGLKRFSSGFLKVVGLWTPPAVPTQNMFGQMQDPLRTWQALQGQLSQDYTVQTVDLSTGQPPQVDVLVVISPQGLDDKARFAVDQYLMRGGALIVAAGNYEIGVDQFAGGLTLQPLQGTLNDMLATYGVNVGPEFVLDLQNEPFPQQVERQVGDTTVRGVQSINFPYFVDVRANAMAQDNPIVNQLQAVTLNFVSPVTLDEAKNTGRQATVLLKSSAKSWLSTNTNLQPNLSQYPDTGFAIEGTQTDHGLAVAVRGSFESFFKGKPAPLAQSETATTDGAATPPPAPQTTGTIEASPESARLVVIGSDDFLTDVMFQISNSISPNRYLNSLQLIQNAVDWSVEDVDLLGIRSRGQTSRVLKSMEPFEERTWEIANYAVALLGLIAIAVLWNLRRRNERPLALIPAEKLTDRAL